MIITTTLPGTTEPRGLTLSSITSLSLKPTPLVSFNVQLPSRTSEVLHSRNLFAINVLPAAPESVDLAKAFSGGYGREVNPFEMFEDRFLVPSLAAAEVIVGEVVVGEGKDGGENKKTEKKTIVNATFTDLLYHPHGVEVADLNLARDIPVISNASAILYCKKHKIFTVQDHEIWVASVFHVDTAESLATGSTLLYQNRAFHALGNEISHEISHDISHEIPTEITIPSEKS